MPNRGIVQTCEALHDVRVFCRHFEIPRRAHGYWCSGAALADRPFLLGFTRGALLRIGYKLHKVKEQPLPCFCSASFRETLRSLQREHAGLGVRARPALLAPLPVYVEGFQVRAGTSVTETSITANSLLKLHVAVLNEVPQALRSSGLQAQMSWLRPYDFARTPVF